MPNTVASNDHFSSLTVKSEKEKKRERKKARCVVYVLFGANGTTNGNVSEGIFHQLKMGVLFCIFRICVVCLCMQRNKDNRRVGVEETNNVGHDFISLWAPNEFLIIIRHAWDV